MKILFTLILFVNFLFSYEKENIKFNDTLESAIFDTINLIYENPDVLRKSSLYIEVSQEPFLDLYFTVDYRERERSNYTLIGVKYNKSVKGHYSTDRLFVISIEKDNKFEIFDTENNLLSKKEILEKQDLILKFVLKYREELKNRIYFKNEDKNVLKNEFMKL